MALLIEMFPDHLKAIGLITVRWSSIDGNIYDILRNYLPSPEEAEKLRTLAAGKQRLECFRKRLKDTSLPSEEKDTLAGAVDRLLLLWEERNHIAHGQYGTMVTDDGLVASWSDIKTKANDPSNHLLQPTHVTVDHLVQHADAVSAAAKPLRNCLIRPDSLRGRSLEA